MTAPILKACGQCGRPIPTGTTRCAFCPPTRRTLTTSQRGYGHDHRKRRKQLLAAAIGTDCPLCHEPMLPGQQLDLDHTIRLTDDPNSRGDRITHAHCNRGRRRMSHATDRGLESPSGGRRATPHSSPRVKVASARVLGG